MTGRSFRVGLALGLVAGAAVAVTMVRRRGAAPALASPVAAPEPSPAPEPVPVPAAAPAPGPVPAPVIAAADGDAWVVPLDGGSCPPTHPVKAKLGSGIFHLPGMAMYGRTRADRCYCTPEAAEADGLRRSSR